MFGKMYIYYSQQRENKKKKKKKKNISRHESAVKFCMYKLLNTGTKKH